MLMSEAFPSAYIKAADIASAPNKEVEVEIESCAHENVGQGAETELLPVLRFKDKKPGLVLNKTNNNLLIAGFGNESDGWIGRKCVLYATTCSYQGDPNTPCIRVRIPQQPEEKPPAAEPEVVRVEDDDVPF